MEKKLKGPLISPQKERGSGDKYEAEIMGYLIRTQLRDRDSNRMAVTKKIEIDGNPVERKASAAIKPG